MNLRVQPGHHVNTWEAGTVVAVDHLEGGVAEASRLISLGCVAITDDAATVHPPLANTAVAEMTDDELVKENKRLRARLEDHGKDTDSVPKDVHEILLEEAAKLRLQVSWMEETMVQKGSAGEPPALPAIEPPAPVVTPPNAPKSNRK